MLLWLFLRLPLLRRLKKQEGKWSRKRDNFVNNNFTISIFFFFFCLPLKNFLSTEKVLINNYDNNSSIINFCMNSYFITFAWQFPLSILHPKRDPHLFGIVANGRFQKLCNFHNKNLPSDKKLFFIPWERSRKSILSDTFPP